MYIHYKFKVFEKKEKVKLHVEVFRCDGEHLSMNMNEKQYFKIELFLYQPKLYLYSGY